MNKTIWIGFVVFGLIVWQLFAEGNDIQVIKAFLAGVAFGLAWLGIAIGIETLKENQND